MILGQGNSSSGVLFKCSAYETGVSLENRVFLLDIFQAKFSDDDNGGDDDDDAVNQSN